MVVKIMLKQHIGAPDTPIVKKGDEVKKGQLIAEPAGLGANIHSSVYGTVSEVTGDAITIDAASEQPDEYVKIKPTDDILEAIKEAGVIGAGGAGFPTHVKLKADLKDGVVIPNSAECEPPLHHNITFVEKDPNTVIRGLKYAMEVTGSKKGIVAIKPRHAQAVRALEAAVKDEKNIEIKFLPDLYPAGDERVIVREILGIDLTPGELPLKAGAVICNVETLKNIARAVEERRPVITKDVTAGGRLKDAKTGKVFLDVPIGIPAKVLIDECGGYVEPHGEIIAGGAFTGKHGSEDMPITKTLGGVGVAMPFPNEKRKVGILGCECGAQQPRLKEIAKGMGAEVVAAVNCKRMEDIGKGRLRCNKPGVCPGQAESVLQLKKMGAQVLLVGSCQH